MRPHPSHTLRPRVHECVVRVNVRTRVHVRACVRVRMHARTVYRWQVAMVMMLEDVLGPLWVYLRFGDVPSWWVVGGGLLLLGTLAWHELAARRHSADRRQAEIRSPEIPPAEEVLPAKQVRSPTRKFGRLVEEVEAGHTTEIAERSASCIVTTEISAIC